MITNNDLITLQSLPLDIKILKTQRRIEEFVEMYGLDSVYIAFSGGKDSTVLLHIARKMYPSIKAVFSNTGLEFPEIVDFVNTIENVDHVKPDVSFYQVLKTEGYPVVSKEAALKIRYLQNPTEKNKNSRRLYLEGVKRDGTKAAKASMLSKKWVYLKDAPFKVSEKCCKYLKKDPLIKYSKEHESFPIMGIMAYESSLRRHTYMKTGCNMFGENPQSKPLGFWMEDDIFSYILENNIEICSVYGDIVKDEKKHYTTTLEKRTGCVFCLFGAHLQKEPNKFQRMQTTHPKLYKYCLEKLGYKEVLEYLNIPYIYTEQLSLFDKKED